MDKRVSLKLSNECRRCLESEGDRDAELAKHLRKRFNHNTLRSL